MKRIERKWMYERLNDAKKPRIEFINGVEEFISHVKQTESYRRNNGKIRCPCKGCENTKFLNENDVKLHLVKKGFCVNYYEWVCHGEDFPMEEEVVEISENPYRDMVNNALRDNYEQIMEESLNAEVVDESPNPQVKAFFEMLHNAEKPVFEGSTMSLLQAAARLLTLKCEYNLPHKCVDGIASLIGDVIPTTNSMTRNFYETKKLLRALQLPHEKIDVCINGCMLFWGDDLNEEKCCKCKEERYKAKKNAKGKNVPKKVLIYFPIGPRLQRLYATKHIAEKMTWHSDYPRVSGTMSHPSDSEAWKNLDIKYPDFAKEPRNVRLGLCTDGFAPFGQFGKSYSCWPVMLTPYNLPPELCMKKQFIFLSLIVPGPRNPKQNLDIYLQPLVHELKELWKNGVFTYDVSKKKNFQLRAALLWTINDFPAYGMLSGWSTSGEHACPYCMSKTKAFRLKNSRKHSWFDCHRQFLPMNHAFRKNNKNFRKDRPYERDHPPPRLTGEKLWERVEHLPTIMKGTEAEFKKLKGKREGWWKQSIFWELPYWKTLLIRHNLDVMHIEKNFFEQLIHTVMDVKNKTSYGPRAKLDLDILCKPRPEANFVLDKPKRKVLCDWVSKLKFPDGYASDLSRCVDQKDFTLHGLKSHDCHVFMERLLPVALKYLIPKNEWNAITEISQFFRDLCASKIKVDDMIRLENNIPEILCKLERFFPPSFFNSMEHLPIHLPYEAKIGGPVQYRWMYPFERFLNHLKQKIGNKAHVEGSICNAYLLEEISNFCSIYFEEHIVTKSNTLHLSSKEPLISNLPELFQDHGGKALGKCKTVFLDHKLHERAHKYILSNCEILKPYELMFEEYIRSIVPLITKDVIWSDHGDEFPRWFRKQVNELNDDLLKALAMGPSKDVKTWKRYSINGYNFRTFNSKSDLEKASLCNGVCVGSTVGNDYYGTLEDVIEFTYFGDHRTYKTTLFRCQWTDITNKGMNVHKEYKIVEVNPKNKLTSINEPFVLTYQVDQVYYTPFPNIRRNKDGWLAAFKIKARSTIDAPVDESFFQEDVVDDISTLSVIENEWNNEDDLEIEESGDNEHVVVSEDENEGGDIYEEGIGEEEEDEEEDEAEKEDEEEETDDEEDDDDLFPSDDDDNDDDDDEDDDEEDE